MDLGYWTGFAEVWFQQRLDRVRCHEASPKTPIEWRDDVKRSKNAKKLRELVNSASWNFISRNGRHVFASQV